MSNDKEDVKRLYSILATINSEEDVEIFLGDLCTYKEIESMAQRIKAAQMLMKIGISARHGQFTQIVNIQHLYHSHRIHQFLTWIFRTVVLQSRSRLHLQQA